MGNSQKKLNDMHGFREEIRTNIDPSRMFKAIILDNDNLFPKLAPQIFKSAKSRGKGGVGTIKHWEFGDKVGVKHVKQRVDELNKSKFSCKFTLYEGDGVLGIFKKTECDFSFVAHGEGGSNCSVKVILEIKNGHNERQEESINYVQESIRRLFHIIESHLLANPNLYA